MRLNGKKLLCLIMDGVDQREVEQLRWGFEEENAQVLFATPQDYAAVQTVNGSQRGHDILVDIPYESIAVSDFDGLILPDGGLSTDLLLRDQRVIALLTQFHLQNLPIFASGEAVELLYASQVLSRQVVVREGTPIRDFLDQAVGVLLDLPLHTYRPTM